MITQHTDVVTEYLREIDLRLTGLPVLQRRELLADLAAHIENERVERNLRGEAELIEVLERLGSPELVAAAAYAEAGPLPPVVGPPMPPPLPPPAPPRERASWVVPVVGAGVIFLLIVMALCAGFLGFSRAGSSQGPAIETAKPAPPAPTASFGVPAPTASFAPPAPTATR
jgi:hypothetical protein